MAELDSVIQWIHTSLADASNAPKAILNGRALTPLQGFNQYGILFCIYKDDGTGDFVARYGDVWFDIVPSTTSWDDVIRTVAVSYYAMKKVSP
jgi:hypothetical protein